MHTPSTAIIPVLAIRTFMGAHKLPNAAAQPRGDKACRRAAAHDTQYAPAARPRRVWASAAAVCWAATSLAYGTKIAAQHIACVFLERLGVHLQMRPSNLRGSSVARMHEVGTPLL